MISVAQAPLSGLRVSPTFAKEALGADETGVGVAIASFSIASLVLRPLVGWSSDRFGRRPLLIGGALLTVAALGLHLVALLAVAGAGLLILRRRSLEPDSVRARAVMP